MPQDNDPPPPDAALALAAEYESAALAALDALDNAGTEAQMAACIRFGKAMAALRQMSAADYGRVNAWLLERKRIPEYGWRKIVVAMQDFARE
jgi:hypothetical protein